jgi:histidine triad (HIT) family protein
MKDECVFCGIVAKREPASVIFEDDLVLGFMDIRPVRPGACLIVPKEHVDHFTDLPRDVAQRILDTGLRIGRRMREVFKPQRVGMVVHGFGVAHAHLVLVPQEDPFDITSRHFAFVKEGRVAFEAARVPLADRKQLDAHAERLRME